MTNADKVHHLRIDVDSFDLSLLPPEARKPGTQSFREAVSELLQEDMKDFTGRAKITVTDEKIEVSWTKAREWPDLLDQAVGKLQEGKRAEGILLLQMLRRERPDDPALLYNLGMALSDKGQLDEAEDCLKKAVNEAPENVNALVALGVALQRQDRTEEATEVLQQAVSREPTNPWAHRNLGACLLKRGRPEEAEQELRQATSLNDEDQQAWFGLGQALEGQGKDKEADEAYTKCIELNQYSQIAEMARNARREFAQKSFRAKGGETERPDAVFYCLDAMERFDDMSPQKMKQLVMEIALKGRSGLDVNDPEKKYSLRHLPGQFSGLQLVSMMYVGFQRIRPGHSIGFDLSQEYEKAKQMYESQNDGG